MRDWAGYLFTQYQFADPDTASAFPNAANADVNQQLYQVQFMYSLPVMMESIATRMTDVLRNQRRSQCFESYVTIKSRSARYSNSVATVYARAVALACCLSRACGDRPCFFLY
jgi:hypothetical protein